MGLVRQHSFGFWGIGAWSGYFGERNPSGGFLGVCAGKSCIGFGAFRRGVVSMVSVALIVLLSGTFSGIFQGTRMLDGVQDKIAQWAEKIGLFPTMVVTSICTSGVFCNQAIAVMLNPQLLARVYDDSGASRSLLAMDMANSVVTIAGLLPWSIACAVPLQMLGVGSGAVPYCLLLWMTPLCYGFVTRRLCFGRKRIEFL